MEIKTVHKKGLYEKFIKRLLDLLIALTALIVLLPILVTVALFVRSKLGSPVLFKQDRPGLNEKIFRIYKFRTMTDKRDENGELLSDSERLTGFGKFLRSASLDELPELWNIIRGDMAIIGPRPLLARYLPYYTEDEKIRHTVRPGLSGLAQINGRNTLEWNSRLALDIEYVNKVSFILDLRIIIKTICKAIKREGVSIVDHASFPDLDVERSRSNGIQNT
jgi:undecaprenyl phosphate N,N'-diacetylbacillosamine 1-phosphate transferase